jgi:protein SCO1/2
MTGTFSASGRAALAGLLAAAVSLLSSCSSPSLADLSGVLRTPPPLVADASLPDVSRGGTDFSFRAEPGEILVVYFGYTSCPDICPTTLADLRLALGDLGADGDRVEVAVVTVDPFRDTDEVLAGYVQAFIPDGHALRTADTDRLTDVAEAFGAGYQLTMNESGEVVDVAHTAFLYAVDEEGRLQVSWPFGVSAADLGADLEILLANTASDA